MMRTQRGYAVVLGLLGSAILLLWWGQLYLVGKRLNQAHDLRTALDTAAYSGAVVQSRSLNALSLLNRAYIGHQIATAHLLTLASWAHFAQTQARQVAQANPPSWLIGSFFKASYARSYQAAQAAPALTQLQTAAREVHARQQQFNAGLYGHFVAELEQQTKAYRNTLIRELIQKNLGHHIDDGELSLNFTRDDWEQISTLFAVPAAIQWVRSLQAHYDFLQRRNQTVKSALPVSKRCPHRRHQLRRMGTTQIDDRGQWSAQDTLSFHALRSNRWIGCYYREYGMGWAWQPEQEAQFDLVHSEDARDSFGDLHFWRWVDQQPGWGFLSEGVNPLANSYAVRDHRAWAGTPFRSLVQPAQPRYGFTLTAQLPMDGQMVRAQSGAQSEFALPPGFRWQKALQGNEQAWFPFWTTSLMSYAQEEP